MGFRWAGTGYTTNWVLCRLLCRSKMGCPHGTQVILATCFTKVPIGLAHVLRFDCAMFSPTGQPGQPDRFLKKKGKGSFYIAQYPVRWTAQSASHFLPSLTDLFIPTPFSASSGRILARQQLRAKTKSLTFPPLSIARYSFIQLSEQGRL